VSLLQEIEKYPTSNDASFLSQVVAAHAGLEAAVKVRSKRIGVPPFDR
jgi:hypothetical protein